MGYKTFRSWIYHQSLPLPQIVSIDTVREIANRLSVELEFEENEGGGFKVYDKWDTPQRFLKLSYIVSPHKQGVIFQPMILTDPGMEYMGSNMYRFFKTLARKSADAVILKTPERVVRLPTPLWAVWRPISYTSSNRIRLLPSSSLMFESEARAALNEFNRRVDKAFRV